MEATATLSLLILDEANRGIPDGFGDVRFAEPAFLDQGHINSQPVLIGAQFLVEPTAYIESQMRRAESPGGHCAAVGGVRISVTEKTTTCGNGVV